MTRLLQVEEERKKEKVDKLRANQFEKYGMPHIY